MQKLITVTFLVLLFSCVGLFSQYTNKIYLKTETNKTFERLEFGVHPDATNSLDTFLGEEELPPIPPPSGLYGWFLIFDVSQNEEVWSYKDFRPYPLDSSKPVTFRFRVHDVISTLQIRWNHLTDNLDSAVLSMDYDIDPAFNFFVDMKRKLDTTINNPSIVRFKIDVWFKDTSSLSVNEFDNTNNISIYPNPANNSIWLHTNDLTEYDLYSTLGEKIFSGKVNYREKLDISHLNSGIYYIVFRLGNKNVITKKLVKI